jgi:hypothetical protein
MTIANLVVEEYNMGRVIGGVGEQIVRE